VRAVFGQTAAFSDHIGLNSHGNFADRPKAARTFGVALRHRSLAGASG
jgi:hypothetical protein